RNRGPVSSSNVLPGQVPMNNTGGCRCVGGCGRRHSQHIDDVVREQGLILDHIAVYVYDSTVPVARRRRRELPVQHSLAWGDRTPSGLRHAEDRLVLRRRLVRVWTTVGAGGESAL